MNGSVEAAIADEENEADKTPQSARITISATGQLVEHEWPFGSWDGVSADPVCRCSGSIQEVAIDLCGHFSWLQETGLQVNNGIPTRAFVAVLRTLIERYQIFASSVGDNEALRNLLDQIRFYPGLSVTAGVSGNASLAGKTATMSLLAYIDNNHDALIDWYADLDEENNKRLNKDQPPLIVKTALPNISDDLYLLESQAGSLREQLVMRAEQAEKIVEMSLPLPRYTQGKDDVYFVQTFLRYHDDCGCERIVWGPSSALFRVASMLDPEAVRPSVIQLPELADIKKGFAKGVTFLTPKSLADAIEAISPGLAFEKKNKKNRLEACLGFSISFSIPIITICAMILLMIILSLLNIFFRWLPWAILKLPRRC